MRLTLPFLLLASTVRIAGAQPAEGLATAGTPVQVAPVAPQAAVPPAQQRPAEPEKQIEFDLRNLLRRLSDLGTSSNQANFEISPYLVGARQGYFGIGEWTRHFAATRRNSQFRLDSLEILKLEGDTATVKVKVAVMPKQVAQRADAGFPVAEQGERYLTNEETLDLRREPLPWENGTRMWRIVPTTFKEAMAAAPFTLQNIAYFAGQRRDTLGQLRASISMHQLKWLGIAVMQFTQDYSEHYAFQNDTWREALLPYVKDNEIFTIPGSNGFYTFNDQLSDKLSYALTQSANTVLFYEGENQKPIFHYDGKAVICFADGHVSLVTPDEADELQWKP